MRKFPTIRSYTAMIYTGEHGDDHGPGLMMSFMTPPEDQYEGVPTFFVMEYGPDDQLVGEGKRFTLNRRNIAELRDWCDRTIFALDFPDRYYEETSWTHWYEFTLPQRVGFTTHAFRTCDICIDEQVEREDEEERQRLLKEHNIPQIGQHNHITQ